MTLVKLIQHGNKSELNDNFVSEFMMIMHKLLAL